ncbi:MAG: Lrp/AsnC family transcriptional regulator [Thermoprotei archaeon]
MVGSISVDGIDAQIVELLQKDGRMSYKEIASTVGVSIPTVKTRIKRLIELGLIERFTAVVSAHRVGGKIRGVVFAKVNLPDANETIPLDRRLSEINEVRAAHFVAGEKQLFLVVEADDVESFNWLVIERLPRVGLSDISSYIITQTIKEEYGVSLKANSLLHYKCNFCHTTIYGKPIVKHYYGGKYYFSGEECAQAYKEILDQKFAKKLENRAHKGSIQPNQK